MQHYKSLEGVHLENSWLTIGSFDGVHLGHQEIIGQLVREAEIEGTHAVALTFYPHPAIILGKRRDTHYLTTPDERAEIIGGMGVDFVITFPFSQETANLSARAFISRLHEHLSFQGLCVGHDFALGKNREGDSQTLTKLGEEFGYRVRFVEPVKNDNVVVSSSRIRAKILEGEVEQAAKFLGRDYRIKGRVIPGDGRGKTLGIPTANLEIWSEQVIPKAGVYATRVRHREQILLAVANIGIRPTFEEAPVLPRVEVHILEFSEEIYGEEIYIDFVSRLRDELRFSKVDALIEQIQKDIAQSKRLLE
ncbi:MAG: bifunctional riboflavin kinase/FAD synthetase [Anaerolineales bacterium]|nr:MAG: bifunctional riboflavin kinase/FAD synthetase [Anaerolineales bacterium]